MRRMLSIAVLGAAVAGAAPSAAGPTTGDVATNERVDKHCVASVFSYLDASVALRGRARFDHLKKRFASDPDELGHSFMNFVAIGDQHYADAAPATEPRCRDSARLP